MGAISTSAGSAPAPILGLKNQRGSSISGSDGVSGTATCFTSSAMGSVQIPMMTLITQCCQLSATVCAKVPANWTMQNWAPEVKRRTPTNTWLPAARA